MEDHALPSHTLQLTFLYVKHDVITHDKSSLAEPACLLDNEHFVIERGNVYDIRVNRKIQVKMPTRTIPGASVYEQKFINAL